MGKIRVAGIVKMENGYAFMHRKDVLKKNSYKDYYVFPGGGLEEGETIEEGVLREIKEEFGICVKIIRQMYEINSEKFNQKEYFFFCEYVSGEFGTGTGPEFSNDPKYFESGKYIPEIIKKENIKDIFLLPTEIRDEFIKDLEDGKFD